jgi:aspartyl-tRNA(Asn)/glutamyl-tRNA(Gln) amidotransferase subunit B
MRSVEEVKAYATALRDILIYLGVNSGDMEKGVMRFEANVSIRPAGSETLGTRTEIKNLNSFRALTRGVTYEIQRQIEVVEAGGAIAQQTLGWDESKEETYPQRTKEYAHDYRYFPEPDIPPLEIEEDWIEEVRAELPELPLAKKRRLIESYDIRPYDANLLVENRAVANYFEEAATQGREVGLEPQEVVNWVTGELFRLLNESGRTIEEQHITPARLVALLKLRQDDVINTPATKQVLEEIFTTGEAPKDIVERLGLAQISDTDRLAEVVATVIEQNPQQVQQYREGKHAVIGWFIGQVMKATRGKANPQTARELLQKQLEQAGSD